MSKLIKDNPVFVAVLTWFDAHRSVQLGESTTALPLMKALRDAYFLAAL